MENELFDKYFGPPMNMPISMQIPTPIPKREGINFIFLRWFANIVLAVQAKF